MKNRNNIHDVMTGNDGFTLIEVIVALAVLTIGILSVNAMQTVSVRGNYTANRLTTASTWATDRAEVLFNLDYEDDELEDNGGGGIGLAGLDDATVATADGNATSPDGEYTIFWNIAEDQPLENLKTIRVIVVRNDLGTPKTLVLNHMKSRFM